MRWAAAAVFLLSTACIVDAPAGKRHLVPVNSVPRERTVKTGAILDGKVALLGATFQPGAVVGGRPTRVALYFQALTDLSKDYEVFVHLEDVDGRAPRTNADHVPAGGRYPTHLWKKGNRIRDEFEIEVPPRSGIRALNLWVGLWDPSTGKRLPLSNPQSVRNDGSNRILLAQLPVSG